VRSLRIARAAGDVRVHAAHAMHAVRATPTASSNLGRRRRTALAAKRDWRRQRRWHTVRARMPVHGRLYLLFTPSLCRTDPRTTLAQALDGGVDLVQWRCKQPDPDGFRHCRELCRERGVPLIVNDDVMLALRARVAGAHVGQDDLPAAAARKLLDERWLGVSTHDVAQIGAAAAAGADYVGFGPCHATATKGYTNGKSAAEIVAALDAAATRGVPLFAIGGITAANLLPLLLLGVERVAVSSAVLASDDPAAAASALRRQLGGVR
jgi:thiamine-phosphate pyrophosphorylase